LVAWSEKSDGLHWRRTGFDAPRLFKETVKDLPLFVGPVTDPLARFAHEVRSLVDAAVGEALHGAAAPPLVLEVPAGGQADLALACFPLAKALRTAPPQVAQDLARRAEAHRHQAPLVARIEAQGGYLNFHADRPAVARIILPHVLAQGAAYGALPSTGKNLILEHTSANPNGPLHVGRARNPIIGDTLVRIFRKAGWNVEAQYYLDDIGKQVAILTWGLAQLAESDLPPAEREKADHRLVRYYQAGNERMKSDASAAAAIQDLMVRSEEAQSEILARFEQAYQPILEGMLESLARIGVRFDSFKKESDFITNRETERVIERLQATPLSRQEEDGALYLDLSAHGIAGKTQRFVYRDGTSLYATRDVAYHFWKSGRADRLINVLGEDHKLQAKQVRICLELLACNVLPEVVFYAFVSLPEGKMSTRRGNVVFLDDLIDEAVERAYEEVKKRRGGELPEDQLRAIAEAVGVGALRYNIVRVQPEKGIAFKWEEALNFEGASAPFLQYAYARCASLLRKAGGVPTGAPDTALLAHASEHDLLYQIARLPRIVDDASRRAVPHLLAAYAQELASALSAFYRDCPVLQAEPPLREARLRLVEAARITLGSTLELVGVPVLEEM
jgi:arginyl-tRNA synthetase